jgi:hypothetical protein
MKDEGGQPAGPREGAARDRRDRRRTQRCVVEDLKARGQDATEAEVHLREFIQELEEAQARVHTIESQAAEAILRKDQT